MTTTDTKTICPTCKTEYDSQPDICGKCGFPFSGTDKEKSIFIGQQITKKGKITGTKDKIKRARSILWVIGALNIVLPFLIYQNDIDYDLYVITGFIIGFIFIGFGFLTLKKPFISILIPLIILILSYVFAVIENPISIFQGLILKVIFLTGLIYGLAGIIQSEKLRKESEFMKEQNYK